MKIEFFIGFVYALITSKFAEGACHHMLTLISWPEDKITVRLVGNKAANLSKLHQAGIPTPNFFCVTTQAYRQFVRSSNLHLVLGKLKSKLDFLT